MKSSKPKQFGSQYKCGFSDSNYAENEDKCRGGYCEIQGSLRLRIIMWLYLFSTGMQI